MLINFKKCCRRKNQINLTLYIKFALIHRIYILNVPFVFEIPYDVNLFDWVYHHFLNYIIHQLNLMYYMCLNVNINVKCTSLNNMSDLLYFDKNSFDLFGKDAFNV